MNYLDTQKYKDIIVYLSLILTNIYTKIDEAILYLCHPSLISCLPYAQYMLVVKTKMITFQIYLLQAV